MRARIKGVLRDSSKRPSSLAERVEREGWLFSVLCERFEVRSNMLHIAWLRRDNVVPLVRDLETTV